MKDMMLYANKAILAPMVRIGTLPMRLLASEYGAGLVYTPEYIDKKIIGCTRIENALLKCIDYVDGDGKLVFRTMPHEKSRLIFQLGTADPDLALLAASKVVQDVAGIDVNCGCPKHFSVHAGMGAALLSNQDKLLKILETLTNNLTVPVSCKIRLLDSPQETVKLCKAIENTGVSALAVHMRTVQERPKDPAHWNALRSIVESINIPVIANGDIFHYRDMDQLKTITGCSSFMFARAAQDNPSVFRKEGMLPLEDVLRNYLMRAIEIDNIFQNTKYVMLQMIHSGDYSPKTEKLLKSKSMKDICNIWGLDAEYEEMQQNLRKHPAPTETQHTSDRKTISYDDEMPYVPRASYRPESVHVPS